MDVNSNTPASLDIVQYGKLVFNADHVFREFLKLKLSIDGYAPGNSERIVGLADPVTHDILGACSFYDWNGVNVTVSFASEDQRWADRTTLAQLFDYVFGHAGHERITAFVATSNKTSQRLMFQTGFECEATLSRAAHDGSDIQIWRMFQENCPWLDPEISYNGTKTKGT